MSENHAASIAGIFRYPVKGLSPEALGHVALSPGEVLPADRRYAIENGPSGFDPENPQHFTKRKFLMLMMDERLAQLHTRYSDADNVLTIRDGADTITGNLQTADGRATIEAFFADRFKPELRGAPKVLFADNFSFSDVPNKYVSLINLASVDALGDKMGVAINPLRFRGNIHVSGWPAWHEFDLLGQTIRIGDVTLKVMKRIVRCAATNVDPDTAMRDLEIPKALMRLEGHADCGIYAEVISGGVIREGDAISITE